MIRKSSGNIVHLVDNSALDIRKREVEQRSAMVQRLVRIIMFLGKQGLAFREYRHEAAHTLTDDDVNHGNFLKEHIDRVVEASKKTLLKRQKDGKVDGNYGRGSLVTFFSHNITTRIIQIIRHFIQESIAEEVKSAGMFSVEMDTTQDVTTQDQCSIVLRCVHNGHVSERLLSLVKSMSGTGASLFSLLKNTLEKYGLGIANCVGGSFDGAANMSDIR